MFTDTFLLLLFILPSEITPPIASEFTVYLSWLAISRYILADSRSIPRLRVCLSTVGWFRTSGRPWSHTEKHAGGKRNESTWGKCFTLDFSENLETCKTVNNRGSRFDDCVNTPRKYVLGMVSILYRWKEKVKTHLISKLSIDVLLVARSKLFGGDLQVHIYFTRNGIRLPSNGELMLLSRAAVPSPAAMHFLEKIKNSNR